MQQKSSATRLTLSLWLHLCRFCDWVYFAARLAVIRRDVSSIAENSLSRTKVIRKPIYGSKPASYAELQHYRRKMAACLISSVDKFAAFLKVPAGLD
jgi:hypothetical protein